MGRGWVWWRNGRVPWPPVKGVDEPDIVWGLEIGDGDSRPFRFGGERGQRRGLPIGETGHDIFLGILISLE